jgi:hypothetical protein
MTLMKRIFSCFFALFCSAFITLSSNAAEKAITIEVTGEAIGSDLEAPREMFERAKSDAQRNAIEQVVGTFVRSHTVVSNGQLAEDLILARVRGRVEKLEVLTQERDKADPNHYRVKIRATVVPVVGDKSEGIVISSALSRTELKEGDEVKIQYRVSSDSHVYIFVIGADNSVTQLLPNAEISGNMTKANRMYSFPPDDSSIRLIAQLLPEFRASGSGERIKIIATKKEEPLLHGGFKEGFKVYDGKSTGLVSDLLKRLTQLDPTDWGETTLSYRISPNR